MSAGAAGVVVPSIVTIFISGFYIGGHVDGLSELCRRCVTDARKKLIGF